VEETTNLHYANYLRKRDRRFMLILDFNYVNALGIFLIFN